MFWVRQPLQESSKFLCQLVNRQLCHLYYSFKREWYILQLPKLYLGPFHNSFVSTENKKFYCPGLEGVDAFSKSWKTENNLFIPPVKLILKVLKHLLHEEVVGTLIILVWKSFEFLVIVNRKKVYLDYQRLNNNL